MNLRKRVVAGVALATGSALALAACGESDDTAAGAEVNWGIASGFGDNWNLWTTDGNNSYLRQALSPMVAKTGYFDPDGEWHHNDAVLAEPVELVSEEPFAVGYTLNPDANWGDGNPITVDDFTYAWYHSSGLEEHCDEKCAPPATSGWEEIESIEEVDGQIVVTYQEGYSSPEWSINHEPLRLPAHIAEENGFEDWQTDPAVMGESSVWFGENMPTWSAGPYIPVDGSPNEFITYEPNPDYAGSAEPGLSKLTLEVIEGTDSLVTELRNGSINGAWPTAFEIEELSKLDDDPDLNYDIYSGSIWDHFDLNTQNEFLSDVELRKAIFTAIDIDDILERVYPDVDVEQKTNTIHGPNSEYFVDLISDTGQGSGDVDAARTILEDAGYTWEGDMLLTPDGDPVTLEIRPGAGNKPRELMAELAQSHLAEIGIELTINPIPDGDLGDVLFGGEYDIVIFGWSGNPAFTEAPEQFYHSESSSNFGKLQVEGLDEEIAEVRATTDLDEAAAAANEVVEIVVENAYHLPISDQPQSIIYDNTIDGIQANGASQDGPLWNVQDWKPAS